MLPLADSSIELTHAFHGTHNIYLVVLSFLIASGAAYASFSHTFLIRQTNAPWARKLWMLSGAVTMGLGVWAMHFTGMLSYQLPFKLSYSPGLTALSVFPAIIAGSVTLWFLTLEHSTRRTTIIAGAIMGSGIGLMHYIGMAAMLAPADVYFKPFWFYLSIVAAVTLACISLAVPHQLRERFHKNRFMVLIAALIMGAAIASMHYIAMHATIFLPLSDDVAPPAQGMMPEGMAFSTLIVAVTLMAVGIFASLMRFRLTGAAHQAEISEAKAEEALARLNKIAARVPGMVYQISRHPNGRFTIPYASGAMLSMFGVSPEDVKADAGPAMDKLHKDDVENVMSTIEQSANHLTPWKLEFRVNTEHGVRWYLGNSVPEKSEDGIVSWSGFITDITEDKAQAYHVHQLSFFDGLTGLGNRRKLINDIAALKCDSDSDELTRGVILHININGFKKLNEAYGPKMGDRLLRAVAVRLKCSLGQGESLARYAADEFVVLLPISQLADSEIEQLALERAKIFQSCFDQVFELDGFEYSGNCRIGVTLMQGVSLPEDYLKQAALAVRDAPRFGNDKIRFFNPQTQSLVNKRFELERELTYALDNNDLKLHFQLKVNDKGQATGAEGLIRWFHADRGTISPGEFIPIAEESGQIIQLGYFVLEKACDQLAKWQEDEATRHLSVAVNVSPRQFFQEDFVDKVLQQIKTSGVPANLLTLEITESVVLENQDIVISRMKALREAGVRFALDDFGTGFSSLSYLCMLPFDEVKIDKMFTQNLDSNKNSPEWAVVEGIIHIARVLGLEVVAEGVETEQQRDVLLGAGCKVFQGYWYSKPVCAEELPL